MKEWSHKDFGTSRRTEENADSRASSRANAYKEDRVKNCADSSLIFQGSMVEFQSGSDEINLYGEDGSVKYDPYSF